jgi:hypothetical protein
MVRKLPSHEEQLRIPFRIIKIYFIRRFKITFWNFQSVSNILICCVWDKATLQVLKTEQKWLSVSSFINLYNY